MRQIANVLNNCATPPTVWPWAVLWRWLLVVALTAAVAHGCHSGDHGDADLRQAFIVVWGS